MTEVGSVYGQALYDLARSEDLSATIWEELNTLQHGLAPEPDFIRLLSSPALSKQERCQILDDSFRGRLQPYVLNFLKILTEKGYIRHFYDCCKAYRDLYYRDKGILLVEAVTAAPLSAEQLERLTKKLMDATGKQIDLCCRVDEACLGGIRLNYDGKQLDDTLSGKLDAMGKLLKNTVL